MRITFITGISLLFLLFLIGGAYWYATRDPILTGDSIATSTVKHEEYPCNADGLRCPDGTIVGRTGTACQFAPCPGVYPVQDPRATSTPSASSVLYGRTVLSPVCPVEQNPPRPECKPKGFSTEITAISQNGIVAAKQVSSSQGSFVMDLLPGTYTLRVVHTGLYPRCENVVVTAKAYATTSVIIACDSGIR